MLDSLELGPDGGGEVQVALADEDRLRLRVVHHVGELFLLAAVVEGDEHSAHPGAGVVGLDVGDGVERHDRHLIALGDAEGLEGVGKAVHALLELGEGAALALAGEGDAVRHHRGGDHQELAGVHTLPPKAITLRPRRRAPAAPGGAPAPAPPPAVAPALPPRRAWPGAAPAARATGACAPATPPPGTAAAGAQPAGRGRGAGRSRRRWDRR